MRSVQHNEHQLQHLNRRTYACEPSDCERNDVRLIGSNHEAYVPYTQRPSPTCVHDKLVRGDHKVGGAY